MTFNLRFLHNDICPAKTLTFWDTLISRTIIKLGMNKSGFGHFLFFFLSLSYQHVQIVSFLAKIGDIHKLIKISFILCFRNLFSRYKMYSHQGQKKFGIPQEKTSLRKET